MQLNSRAKDRGLYEFRKSKLFLIMKLTAILLTVGFLKVSAAGFSQTISLEGKNISLEKVLLSVEQQTGYYLFYKHHQVRQAKAVNLNLKNVPLDKALEVAFKDQPLKFTVVDKTIIVSSKNEESRKEQAIPPITIKGKIVDQDGLSLPGASVKIKGSSMATITDINGGFSFRNIDSEAVLIVSYTGFVTSEVPVNGKTELSISLKTDLKKLNEVVVVGYGTQNKSDVSSSIATFKPTELNARPVLGPDQMLQGRVAGVVVTGATGVPGSRNRVSIRGIGSLSASNEPLYVIDGIPVTSSDADLGNYGQSMNPLSELNPNDISSIEVLKDAAASSIYGSRATNGVIIITTKSGSKGMSKVEVGAYTGVQNLVRLDKLKMAGSDLYVEVINESVDNFNTQYGYTPADSRFAKGIVNPYPGRGDTDWLDLILRTAHSSNVNVALSGGSEKGSYYVSGGYTNQEGTFLGNVLKKYNAKVNLANKVTPWLNFGANTNFSYSNNNRVPNGYNIGTNLIPRALEQRPFDRPIKPDGSYYVGGTNELLNHNPLQALNEEDVYLDNYRVLGNFFATVDITPELSLKSSFGADLMFTQDYVYYKNKHPYGAGNGKLVDDRRTNTNIIFENTINYKKKFGDLAADFLAGHSFQRVNTSLIGVDGQGFPSPSFDVNVVAAEIVDAYTNLYGHSMQSFFGRANFSFKDRYLLNVSMRSDGSSRFSPKNRYGYFPSASAGWNVSKEPFWGPSQTSLKLRASYGATGNLEGINAYAYQALTGGGYNYNNDSGIAITSFGNEDLTWEKAKQFNGGFDLGFNNNAFSVTADYFIKNTTNLLYSKPTHATTGFTSIISNIGSMRNWGFELGLNSNLEFGDFKWRSDFNIGLIKNELTSLLDNEPLLIGRTHVLKVGEQVGSFYIYKQQGIFQDDSEVPKLQYDAGIRAGDVKFEDVNGDGKIDVNDRQVLGSANPDFTGGFNNTFTYKNIDLSVFVNFSVGSEIYQTWIGGYRLGNGVWPMLESEALKRWTGPGTSNTTPRAIWGNTVNSSSTYSTRFMHDGSYLRFRTVSLGYTLPEKTLSKFKISKMRLYVQADNLFLWTKYPLLDPEVNISLSPTTMGEDFLMAPQPRSFNFGVNFSF